jgi:hypothetical protein
VFSDHRRRPGYDEGEDNPALLTCHLAPFLERARIPWNVPLLRPVGRALIVCDSRFFGRSYDGWTSCTVMLWSVKRGSCLDMNHTHRQENQEDDPDYSQDEPDVWSTH